MNKNALIGILLMIAAMQVVPGTDIFIRNLLDDGYSPFFASWGLSVAIVVVLLPLILLRYRRGLIKESVHPTNILRGFFAAITSTAFFWAIEENPIPDTLTMSFIAPFAVAVFAGIFLGERLDWKRLVAIAVGLGGILIVLRPGGGSDYNITILFGLVAGLANAAFLVTTRYAGRRASPWVMLFLTSLWVVVFTTPAPILFWQTPDWLGVVYIVGAGCCIILSQYFFILSLRFVKASTAGPFLYTEIIAATALSAIFFGEFPDVWVFVGIGVIVVSGVYVTLTAVKPTVR